MATRPGFRLLSALFVSVGITAAVLAVPTFVDELTPVKRAAELLPADGAMVLTIRDGDRRVHELRDLYHASGLDSGPLGELLRSNPGVTAARIGLMGLAASAKQTPWEALGNLLGENLSLALLPSDGADPILAGVAVLRAPQDADRFIDSVMAIAGLKRNGRPNPDASFAIDKTTVYAIDDNAFFARTGRCLAFATDRAVMTSIIKRSTNPMAADEDFMKARTAVPDDAMVWIYTDTEQMRSMMDTEIPVRMDNALAGLIFAAWHDAVRNADDASAWVMRDEDGVQVHVEARSAGDGFAARSAFAPTDLLTPRLDPGDLPGYLGAIELSRDWAGLMSSRESFLSLSAAGDLVNFATTLSALMGGLDFIDDVMAKISGPVRVISASIERAEQIGSPTPSLPSFALVAPLRLDDAAKFASQLSSATLSALSVVNIERAEEDQRPLLIDMVDIEGERAVVGRFPAVEAHEDNNEPITVGIEYNFAPCSAVIGDQLVVASSVEMLRAIAEHTAVEQDADTVAAIDHFDVAGPMLLKVLRENEESLVVSRMIEDDLSRDEASGQIALLFGMLEYLDNVHVNSHVTDETLHAIFDLSFRAP